MTRFDAILRTLAEGGVDFVLIGGLAATAHGSARTTLDVDVVYCRSLENVERLAAALRGHAPYLRGAPPGLPFTFDAATIRAGCNFTLTTDLGALDLLGEVPPGLDFDALRAQAEEHELFGYRVRVASVAALITMKRAAGRPKDLEAIAELELIGAER